MLQPGITVTIHNGVNLLVILTERTIVGRIGTIIRNILLGKNRMNGHFRYFIDGAENSSNSPDFSSIIEK